MSNSSNRGVRVNAARVQALSGAVPVPSTLAAADPLATRLYPLEPKGLGTLETESLTSYVRRLAQAHVVSPSALLRYEVLEPNRVAKGQRHPAFHPVASTEGINGAHPRTELVVAALERNTRGQVRQTTMLGRDGALCFNDAFRVYRAWCPECLREDDPYDRLLWAFAGIHTCARHEQQLVEICGNAACARPHRPWHHRASVSSCPHCTTALTAATSSATVADPGERILRDVLAMLLTDTPLTADAILAGLVHQLSTSSWAQVVAASRLSQATLSGIRRRTRRIAPGVLVRLAISSGESLGDYLSHPPQPVLTRRHNVGSGAQTHRSKLKSSQAVLGAALRVALTQPEGSIPSAKAFARAHTTTTETLRRHFPELITALGRAFLAQERCRRERREAGELSLLRKAVLVARREGTPTRRAVERLIGRPGLFRQRHIRAAYLEMTTHDAEGECNAA